MHELNVLGPFVMRKKTVGGGRWGEFSREQLIKEHSLEGPRSDHFGGLTARHVSRAERSLRIFIFIFVYTLLVIRWGFRVFSLFRFPHGFPYIMMKNKIDLNKHKKKMMHDRASN